MKFLKEIFQEETGKYSFGRTFTAIVILFYLFFSGYIAQEKKSIPDIPDNLQMLIAALYGVNKAVSTLSVKLNRKKRKR